MGLVLGLTAIVLCVAGALIGGVIARFLPRSVFFVLWAAMCMTAGYIYMQRSEFDELERVGANIWVFAILLPGLTGSLIAGGLVLVRKRRPPISE